jgi:actin related protein 2/3 complex subunit 2
LDEEVKKFYGDLAAPASKDATVTLKIPNVEKLDAKTKEKYLQDIPLLKRVILTSPFKAAFDKFVKKEKFEAIRIPYRAEENIYIVNDDNKALIVVFSIRFKDMDDIVLAKVFLQELKDARRDKTLGSAPGVSFSQGQRPVELNNVKNVTEPAKLFDYGFVTMSLFNSHFEEKNRNNTIERLIVFRNYLHYHLKCSKAYMHIRMRDRVTSLLQNLEAAKDNTGKVTQKKTATGRVFERK